MASGIPRDGDLARALTELDGLAVNTSQAQEIGHLYNRLVYYTAYNLFPPLSAIPRHNCPKKAVKACF